MSKFEFNPNPNGLCQLGPTCRGTHMSVSQRGRERTPTISRRRRALRPSPWHLCVPLDEANSTHPLSRPIAIRPRLSSAPLLLLHKKLGKRDCVVCVVGRASRRGRLPLARNPRRCGPFLRVRGGLVPLARNPRTFAAPMYARQRSSRAWTCAPSSARPALDSTAARSAWASRRSRSARNCAATS